MKYFKQIDVDYKNGNNDVISFQQYSLKPDFELGTKLGTEIILEKELNLIKSTDDQDRYIRTYRINGLSEYLLPFCHVKLLYYARNGIDPRVLLISGTQHILWKYIEENIYEIQILFYQVFRDTAYVYYDCLCDLSLVILNEDMVHVC